LRANKGIISELIKQKNWHYEKKQKGETKYITRSPPISDFRKFQNSNFGKDEIPLMSRFKCQGKFIEKIRPTNGT